MGKYQRLWEYVSQCGGECLELSFDEAAQIAGVPMDHSFLNEKKALLPLGYRVEKISMKNQTVRFLRQEQKPTGEKNEI